MPSVIISGLKYTGKVWATFRDGDKIEEKSFAFYPGQYESAVNRAKAWAISKDENVKIWVK